MVGDELMRQANVNKFDTPASSMSTASSSNHISPYYIITAKSTQPSAKTVPEMEHALPHKRVL